MTKPKTQKANKTATVRKVAAQQPASTSRITKSGRVQVVAANAKAVIAKSAKATQVPTPVRVTIARIARKLQVPAGAPRKPRVRMTPEARRELLDVTILRTFRTGGIAAVTRTGVAAAAGVSSGLLRHYFTNVEGLRKQAIALAFGDGTNAAGVKLVKKAVADGYDAKLLSRKIQAAIK